MYHRRFRNGQIFTFFIGLIVLLAGCGTTNSNDGEAGAVRVQLNAAIAQAAAIGVPYQTITSLYSREKAIDDRRGWFGFGDFEAAQLYNRLIDSVYLAQTTAAIQAQNQAQKDVTDLTNTIRHNTDAGIFTPLYASWQDELGTQLVQARTPNDFRAISDRVHACTTTARSIANTYSMLVQFGSSIEGMRRAGLGTWLPQAEFAQNQRDYARASTALDFDLLRSRISAQTVNLVNDEAQAIPFVAGALLSTYQHQLDLLQGYGETITPYQQIYQRDQVQVSSVTTLPDYLAFQRQVHQHMDDLALPLARGQSAQDLQRFQSLLDLATQRAIDHYEYDSEFGLSDVTAQFRAAQTMSDFTAVDIAITNLTQHVRAMLTDAQDGTPFDQPHSTDFDVMSYYHITGGQVFVISLREQALRAYANGQLVQATLVTTGRPERPTPPGIWHIASHQTNITFTSGDAPDSPFYYAPTHVNYALEFHEGGFFIHDAWWRLQFGPGSNLPHEDPLAFNGGSHGCVNVPLQQMSSLYAWASDGATVIIY